MIVDINWKNARNSDRSIQADRWIGKMGAFRVNLIYNTDFRYMTLELGGLATSIGLPRLKGKITIDRILKSAEARIGQALKKLKIGMDTLQVGNWTISPTPKPDPHAAYIRLWDAWGEFDRTVKSTKSEYQALIAPAIQAGNPIDGSTIDSDILDSMLDRRHQKTLPPRAVVYEIQMV